MNKDSFDKIINLDVNDIKINDFKQALFFFLELKDENLKKIFLDNYKKAISIFFKKNSSFKHLRNIKTVEAIEKWLFFLSNF